jgi:hypothetical protein
VFNGVEVFRLENVIPEGTYLVPLPPSLLAADENGLPRNTIEVRTRHLNFAHYSVVSGFRLCSRHSFVERLVVAGSQEEADAVLARETPELNHTRPDIGLFVPAKTPALSKMPQVGAQAQVALVLGNMGESAAEDVRVEVYDQPLDADGKPQGAPVAEATQFGRVEPMTLRKISISFPFGGQARNYIVVRSSGADFDPSNNVHTLSFGIPAPPPIAGATGGQDFLFAEPLPDDPEPPHLCRILYAETGEEAARAPGGRFAGPLPAGRYRVALTRFYNEGKEVTFPQVIEHREDEPLQTSLRTALEIVTDPAAGRLWRWEVVRADAPDAVVQWHFGSHPVMLLPPGDYRVALRPTTRDETSQRLVWPKAIALKENEHAVLQLDSGLTLALPADADLWAWKAARADSPGKALQWHRADRATMLLPPGEYQATLLPTQFEHQGGKPMVWPVPLRVEPGKFTRLEASSSIRLELPEEAVPLASWHVARDAAPDEIVQWHKGSQRAMLLPPGTYRVGWRPRLNPVQPRVTWPEAVKLKEGQRLVVRPDSGLRLVGPAGSKPPAWFRIMERATKQTLLEGYGTWAVHVIPPGVYAVDVRAGNFPMPWRPAAAEVRVEKGRIAKIPVPE